MKLISLLATLAFIFVTACHSNNDSATTAYPAIPPSIDLDKSSLASMSDEDYAEGKTAYKALSTLVSVDNQLFTAEENDEDRIKREEEWTKLNDQQKALVEDLRANCTITEDNPEGEFSALRVGATMPIKKTASANGPACKTNSTNNLNGLLTILAVDTNTLNGEIGGRVSVTATSSFNDLDSQKIMGYSNIQFSGNANARVKLIDGDNDRSYVKIQGTGSFDLVDAKYKTITLNTSVEVLSNDSKNTLTKKTHMELNVNDKTYIFTKITNVAADDSKTEDLYLGDRLIPKAEAEALGDLPLEIDSIAK